jgi:ATP synthase F1 complex assembly factor 1
MLLVQYKRILGLPRVVGWYSRQFASSSSKSIGGGFNFPSPRKLNELVKLDLLAIEEPEQIRSIWSKYHAEKDDAIAQSLGGKMYEKLVERASLNRYFIFPVYRQEGFFNMLCQFQEKVFLLTYIEAFKENPAMAPACLTISLYDEFIQSKDTALLRADVINMLDKKVSFA